MASADKLGELIRVLNGIVNFLRMIWTSVVQILIMVARASDQSLTSGPWSYGTLYTFPRYSIRTRNDTGTDKSNDQFGGVMMSCHDMDVFKIGVIPMLSSRRARLQSSRQNQGKETGDCLSSNQSHGWPWLKIHIGDLREPILLDILKCYAPVTRRAFSTQKQGKSYPIHPLLKLCQSSEKIDS